MTLITSLQHPNGAKIRLYHGASRRSASAIASNGANLVAAQSAGGLGDFWVTADRNTAIWFARVNPDGPPPALFSFELLDHDLRQIVTQHARSVRVHQELNAIQFHPPSFTALNRAMQAKKVEALA